jgi:succinoglycan biosynthesis transport protein ExoP
MRGVDIYYRHNPACDPDFLTALAVGGVQSRIASVTQRDKGPLLPDLANDRPSGPPAVAVRPVEIQDVGFSLQGFLRSLQRSWILIAICVLLGGGIGLFAALLPRHYTAVSRIEVRPGSSSQYRVDKSDLLNIGDDSTKLETETMILESDSLLLDTAHKLNLDTNPDFMGPLPKIPIADGPKAEEILLTQLHHNIHGLLLPRTEIIQVSCNSRSALLSARVVNTLVAEYIQRLFESRFTSTKHVSQWLSGQLDDLKQQVESDQEKLIQLQSRLGIVGLDQNHDIVVSELEDLTKAADEARIQRIIAEARYRILSSGDINLLEGGQDILEKDVPSASQISLLANLRNQKAQTEARYAGLSSQFGPKYPEVEQAAAELATLNAEIQQEQARVLHQSQQAYEAATTNEHNTVATLDAKKSQAFTQQGDMVQYQILLHDYESSRALYEGLVQRLQQAGIVAGLESSEVDIIDMARVPGRPSEISRTVTVALGLIFGFAVGVIGALLVTQFDQRLHDLSAVESEMGLALLSITTRAEKDDSSSSRATNGAPLDDLSELFINRPNSPFVESMWSLRASLLLSNPGHPPRTIMFTSCNPGEGKSTVACGQACALALRNARVLLVDGDMRRPTIMRRFGLKNTVGLSSVLAGRATLDEAIQPVESIPNLSIMTSGPVPPSAALILASEAMSQLMATLQQRFDFIVIDSPPLLGLADASTLAQFAEAIVLVLSYSQLNKAQIQRARKVLQRVGHSVTGIALNFADPNSLREYGYGYGYYASSYQSIPEDKGGAK